MEEYRQRELAGLLSYVPQNTVPEADFTAEEIAVTTPTGVSVGAVTVLASISQKIIKSAPQSAAQFGGLSITGIAAFLGGLATVFFVYHIAGMGGTVQTLHLLLTGTAVSSFLSAMISFLMTRNQDELKRIYMWTLGSFDAASWEKVRFLGIFLLLCGAVLFAFSRELNLLATGEDAAVTLGASLVYTL